jgi:hypothetical protein
MPFFEEHVLATKSLIDAYGMLLFPIISNDQRQDWEENPINNRRWANKRKIYGDDQSASLGSGDN